MPDEARQLASPISVLLEESEHGAGQVLLLSYTLNLAFWERFGLGAARGLGARVTTVADAHMTSADASAVRYAGVTYLDGRAACRQGGAFHPKLLVVASEDRAVVVIGSGNATIPGWHDNAELWTVLRGDTTGAPRAFVELSEWLRRLHEHVDFSRGVEPALGAVADLISAFPTVDEGPRLVTSLDSPILDQLPGGPVDELVVAAPFHDPGELALRDLRARMKPRRTVVAIQPRVAAFDGKALRAALDSSDVVVPVASGRYHHGKLYEWVVGTRRVVLTGSPNLSTAAMRLSMSSGGNCELGIISEVESSLAPPSGEALGADLETHTYPVREETRYAIVLLGATALADGVELVLQRPLTVEGFVETARAGGGWAPMTPLPPAQERVVVPLFGPPGTAVRVTADGTQSNVVFILDPVRILRVRIAHEGRVLTDEDEVFGDPAVAEAFLADVAALRFYLDKQDAWSVAGRAGEGDRGASNGGHLRFESWEEYLDACASHVGQQLLDFAFGLPRLAGTGTLRGEEASFVDLDQDRDADRPDDEAAGEQLPDLRGVSGHRRIRYRRWCERLAELSPALVPAGRLLVLRLILRAAAGGLWTSSSEWVPLTAKATAALGADGEAFDQERTAMASLAAVGLAAIHGEVDGFASWTPAKGSYEQARDAVFDLLLDVDAEVVERYARELVPALGSHLEPHSVVALRDSLLNDDVIDEAVAICAREFGIDAERDGSLIRVLRTQSGDPRWTLLRIVALAETAPIVAASADAADGSTTTVVSKPPHLVITRTTGKGTSGKWYVGKSPRLVSGGEDLGGEREWWAHGTQPPDEVRVLLDEVGGTGWRTASAR